MQTALNMFRSLAHQHLKWLVWFMKILNDLKRYIATIYNSICYKQQKFMVYECTGRTLPEACYVGNSGGAPQEELRMLNRQSTV